MLTKPDSEYHLFFPELGAKMDVSWSSAACFSTNVSKCFRSYPMATISGGYTIVDFDELSPVRCPCGQARRAFLDVPDFPCTIHRT
jgi:hypothetical protein